MSVEPKGHVCATAILHLVIGIAGTVPTLAAPPEVTALFPAGGARGTEVRVALQGKVDATKGLELWSSDPGIEFIEADGKDAVKLKVSPEAAAGVAWIAVHDTEGVSTQRPFVVGSVPEVNESEPNNEISTDAVVTPLPTVINGVLQKSGDVDSFGVDLKAGETLVAVLDALHSLGSPMDGLVQVADRRGFVLIQNDDAGGFDPRLAFTAPRDGRYFVRVFAFPAQPDSSIRFSGAATYIYRLTLTTGPVVTRWLPAAVAANAATSVRGYGWNIGTEGIAVDLSGPSIGMHQFSQSEFLSLAPLQVVSEPVVVASADNTRAVPQAVALPVCVTGSLGQPKAEQSWKFSATKGQKIALRVTTAAIGSPMDAVLRIYDSSAKKLLDVDDSRKDDFEINSEYSIPADGEYVAVVSERFWHGGADYVYTLLISPSTPDVLLTVSNNAYNLKGGDKLEIPVTLERRSGMSAQIRVFAAGLPDGVTAEAVTSEPKGDSSKSVTLKLESTREAAWIGPLVIVGETAEDPAIKRTAVVAPVDRQIVAPQVLLKVMGQAP